MIKCCPDLAVIIILPYPLPPLDWVNRNSWKSESLRLVIKVDNTQEPQWVS